MVSKVESYELDPDFERSVAVLCVQSQRFWGTIGYSVEPQALRIPECKLLVQAARAIAKELGTGPSSPTIAIQRMRRWRHEGKVTLEQINSCIDLLFEHTVPPEKEIISELRPVIQRKIQAEAVKKAIETYGKDGDFSEVTAIINKANRIGQVDTSIGMRLGITSLKEIERLRHLEKMSLGIPELDIVLRGGPPRGTETVFIGPPGAGKSMTLSHVVSKNAILGMFCVVATLEVPEPVWVARVMANITDTPIDVIMDGDHKKLKKQITKLHPTLGTVIVKDFPAKLTTMLDIREWVKQVEAAEGYECDLIAIDYGDKMRSHSKDDQSEYSGQGTVFEDFRLFVHERKKWGITASQSTRRAGKEKNRRIELDDVADSMHKVRVPDLVITLNPQEDQMAYHIAKNRYGKSDITVGPFPYDFECGKIVI